MTKYEYDVGKSSKEEWRGTFPYEEYRPLGYLDKLHTAPEPCTFPGYDAGEILLAIGFLKNLEEDGPPEPILAYKLGPKGPEAILRNYRDFLSWQPEDNPLKRLFHRIQKDFDEQARRTLSF